MFAAIYIPDFPVEAIVRAEPELREHAVAVVEGVPPLVHVVAVNEKAAQAGVEPGMTKLQAEERLASEQWPVASDQKNPQAAAGRKRLTLSRPKEGRDKGGATSYIRQRSVERETAAHAALLDCACGFSPRVEDTAADTVVLDVAGVERIFGPPAKLARDVARRCSELGLEVNVAVAWNTDTAALAARGFAGVTLIPEGTEAQRIGELPVEVLLASQWSVASGPWPAETQGPSTRASSQARSRSLGMTSVEFSSQQAAVEFSPQNQAARGTGALEILETLERWGVRNLRALAALPEVAVAERLGQDGLQLQKLARGETRRPLVVAEPPLVFEEAAELEYPVEALEPLAFLLNRMLEQLCARLAARALAMNEIKLRLQLEVESDCRIEELTDCRIENHHASSAGNRTILQSDNPSIHERTLRLPVPMLDAKVLLKLVQLDLQAHPPSAPVTKVWLLAEPAEPRRTQNGLFVPQAPEEERLSVTLARIERVVGKSRVDGRRSMADKRVGSPEILDTHWPDGFRMKPFSASGQWSVASGQHNGSAGEGERAPATCPLTALRVFRPALAAVVTVREGKPAQVASPERPTMRGEVVWCAGPWRSSGEWWSEQAWSRQEWDVAVRNEEGVTLYRIYRDEIGGRWWVQGTYD